MRKKLLLPTDFSENSWNAIVYAITMFQKVQCDFYLLNLFQSTGYSLDNFMVPEPGEKNYEALQEKSGNGLARTLERITELEDNPNHEFFLISEYNSMVEGIKNCVAKKDIELIVMGTKGNTNADHVIYGSNAVQVMDQVTNCPVLAIPTTARFKRPKEIVFPTNYKTHFKRRELQHLVELVKLNNSTLILLYIAEDDTLSKEQQENQKLLLENLDEVSYKLQNLHHPDVKSGLNCFVESRDSDLVTFVNRKHGFFEQIVSKPLVKDLGYRSKVPVLALHEFPE
ncbi:universal stress protein [Aquimarina brevivitae]|uniref:Nucleotide-binding universal stress UspA family protein n=1 Tax=Aquimarina brevivitae TaxID=323412 RepID=A0A4V2F7G1_9FLAO|nr:universal stress protein [Aquimarina brevivitae]RZS99699.1 nucleotide-binding universal stress UspA family protein [Aquimarina brevivitae]